MTTLTGRKPRNTYKDLLQVSNSNAGVDGTMRSVEDGEGTASGLSVSATQVGAEDGAANAPGYAFTDDLDNGWYRIGANNWAGAAAGVKVIEVSAAGEWTFPLQPAFLVSVAADRSDVTGDSTAYTIVWGTEVFDKNADHDGTTFTAPVTGLYEFHFNFVLDNVGSGHTTCIVDIVTSNRSVRSLRFNPYAVIDGSGSLVTCNGSMLVDMDAADTCTISVAVTGSTKTVDVRTAATGSGYWSGRLCQ